LGQVFKWDTIQRNGLTMTESKKRRAHPPEFKAKVELDVARQWGLYISTSRGLTSIGIEEPALFSEPAVFIVRPDTTLYYGAVKTMPFARPNFADLFGEIDFSLAKNYPARGEYTGTV